MYVCLFVQYIVNICYVYDESIQRFCVFVCDLIDEWLFGYVYCVGNEEELDGGGGGEFDDVVGEVVDVEEVEVEGLVEEEIVVYQEDVGGFFEDGLFNEGFGLVWCKFGFQEVVGDDGEEEGDEVGVFDGLGEVYFGCEILYCCW